MIWYPWPVQGLCRSINLRTWDYFNQIASRFYCSSSKYLHNHRTREGYKTERVHLPSSWTVIMKTMKWVRAETSPLHRTPSHPDIIFVIWSRLSILIQPLLEGTPERIKPGRTISRGLRRRRRKDGYCVVELSSIIICKSLCQIEPCGVSAAGSSFVKQSRECGRVFVMAKYVQLVLGKWQKLSLCKRRRRNDDDDDNEWEKSWYLFGGSQF